MKPILILLLIFLTSFTGTEQTNVYICKSKSGKKYHYREDCRGLKACTHKVEKITLKKAKAAGKLYVVGKINVVSLRLILK